MLVGNAIERGEILAVPVAPVPGVGEQVDQTFPAAVPVQAPAQDVFDTHRAAVILGELGHGRLPYASRWRRSSANCRSRSSSSASKSGSQLPSKASMAAM